MTGPLWITYAWSDNAEGDFDFLVQELSRAGISAIYDKIALVPGRKLWAQIGNRISSDPLSGWAYLVTPNSLASAACQEELAYALQRALEAKGEEFPLIGLLHGVSIRDVPLALRVRLCVNLANPDCIEEIRAAISGTAPRRAMPEQDPLVLKIHRGYLGQPERLALEIRPRFGELRYWRWAFPSSGPQPIAWGTGPANGSGIGSTKREVIEGEFSNIGGTSMKYVGAGDPITPSASAYAVFDRVLPQRCFFGLAKEPFSTEASGTIIELG
jgi:TIR domain